MASNCHSLSKREGYISELRHHIPVDTFGKCGDRRCSEPRAQCYRRLAESHLFYLAFENSLCDDYITEKFWLPLEVGLVPVVRGPPPDHYRRVAPPNSYIHVEEFSGPKALAEYLLFLSQNQTEYDRYHEWRRSHHTDRLNDKCALCRRLMDDGQDPAVRLSDVWSAGKNCREPHKVDTTG